MPDTGAPWNIPYVAAADLVRDYPVADQAQAEAVAAGLSAAKGLVAVKSALFTGTQVEAGILAGANFAVTDLTITHEVAHADNKLIISAFIGTASESGSLGRVGLAVDDGSGLIAVGASPGSRTAVTAGGLAAAPGSAADVVSLAATYVHTPGAGSKTYTVRAINVSGSTLTLNINRAVADGDTVDKARGVSGIVIQEVSV